MQTHYNEYWYRCMILINLLLASLSPAPSLVVVLFRVRAWFLCLCVFRCQLPPVGLLPTRSPLPHHGMHQSLRIPVPSILYPPPVSCSRSPKNTIAAVGATAHSVLRCQDCQCHLDRDLALIQVRSTPSALVQNCVRGPQLLFANTIVSTQLRCQPWRPFSS